MAEDTNIIELTIEVVTAYVSNNNMRADDMAGFIATTHAAIAALDKPTDEPEQEVAAPEHVPAVTVRKSLSSKDHIISMIDGKPYRTLRRHLSTNGLTPDEYRARYNLKADYPMVAETYSEARRAMAKKIGLGRKPGEKAPAKKSTVEAPAKKRGRPASKPNA
ncbi:MucR family transcriptional regulator [Sphingomonas colocasiae]|uniref:MucR family transcriptional regulator n=1 Tax=Sphingomonas colocasiae TaxID=1848973 RepID=A0ABS7PS90_9SPHN|nr:MucR family transcriptional regulator [Sphingomonas colocasiae]MBY8823849.1 MucR family transcriptional regulator [Sphingomonas colocasiae]